MDELSNQSLRAALHRPTGIEAAREFLQTYVSDADMEHLRAIIEHMRNVNAVTIIDGLEGLEDVLAEMHPPGFLQSWWRVTPNDLSTIQVMRAHASG